MAAAGLGGDDGLRAALLASHDVTTLTRPVVEANAALTAEAGIAALAHEDPFRAYAEGRPVIALRAEPPPRLTAAPLRGLLTALQWPTVPSPSRRPTGLGRRIPHSARG